MSSPVNLEDIDREEVKYSALTALSHTKTLIQNLSLVTYGFVSL